MKSEKLIAALDCASLREAERLVRKLAPIVKIFKVGQELFTEAGSKAIQMVHAHGGRVFLDLKFHDIPNTVGAACEAAARMGVFMLNVHASGGRAMMLRAVEAVHEAARGRKRPILLAVTVLTSLTERDLKETGIRRKVSDQVRDLARLAKSCGMDGVVASGEETALIRKAVGPSFLIVVPGIRPLWAVKADQKRIVTPREAVQRGADFIVVGRPITQHRDPRDAAQMILDEMRR